MNKAIIDSKKAVVEVIANKFKAATSSIIVEYRGLSVAEVTQLRRDLRKENIEFKVYKNSMAQRAASEVGAQDLVSDLVGPNAIAFGEDAVAPARVLFNFAKEHPLLVLKKGIVEGKVVDLDTIKELASLPGREGLISMFMSCIQSPVRNFAYALDALIKSREENGESNPVSADEKAESAKAAAPQAKEESESAITDKGEAEKDVTPKEAAIQDEPAKDAELSGTKAEVPAESAPQTEADTGEKENVEEVKSSEEETPSDSAKAES